MNILLVYTNRNRGIMMPPPIGLAFLAKPLLDKGYSVELLDLMFSDDPEQDLINRIDEFQPKVVGFSIRNLDNQDMLNPNNPLQEIKQYVTIARKKGSITVLGGTALTTFPKEMLEYMEADYGIAGQGEVSFATFIEMLNSNKVGFEIPGLVYRMNEQIILNQPLISGYRDTDAAWGFLDFKKYQKSLFPASVVTKTGCPYQCSYCDAQVTFGNKFVFRTPQNIVKDIRTIKETHRQNILFLTDPCFNVPLDNAKQVLKAIIAANLKVYLVTTFVPVKGQYDQEFFELYKKAGGLLLVMGTESFSDIMLRNYNKPFSTAEIYDSSKMADKTGINYTVEMLLGGPGENEQTVKESIAFLAKINYSMLLWGIGIRVLPGCSLFQTAKAEGIVNEPSELLFPRFYLSKDLDVNWTKQFINKSSKRYWYKKIRMSKVGMKVALAKMFGIVF